MNRRSPYLSDNARALLDIMLGFLRSRLDKEQMMVQQRKAVRGILRWCESQDEVKVTGNTITAAAGEHLDWVRKRLMSATDTRV